MFLRIATASINTLALDLPHNKLLIEQSILRAANENVDVLLLPELCLSGYGCEDMFLSDSFLKQCQQALFELLAIIPHSSMVVAVGLPWQDSDGTLYNACALLVKNKILGIVCKQQLAKTGVHYEPRWFSAWPQKKSQMIVANQQTIAMGDLTFEINGLRLGFEICEDAWVANRVAEESSKAGIDIFLNPSASHFAIGKHQQRYELVHQASKNFDCVYVYCNLIGCEAGRTIYDGGNLIAQKGALLLQGKQFSFHELAMEFTEVTIKPKKTILEPEHQFNLIRHDIEGWSKNLSSIKVKELTYEAEHDLTAACFALALGLWDWQRKTKQRGYVVSLSGGADSALCACAVYLAHQLAYLDLGAIKYGQVLASLGLALVPADKSLELVKYQVMPQVLTTAYQSSINSGKVTEQAARELALGLGAKHHLWSIEADVLSYQSKAEKALGRSLTWQQDDIALQNIQARVRSPGIWMLANVEQKLLIATSNLSEASVGYCTMDGDTSGVLAPIGGISKTLVLKLNDFLCKEGIVFNGHRISISELSAVIKQVPTAELRPQEQHDEIDLMPFEILDAIRELSQITYYAQQDMLAQLKKRSFQHPYQDSQLHQFISKYYQLYARNQWKRERLAVSFHIEHDSACPKTYRRFPVLS